MQAACRTWGRSTCLRQFSPAPARRAVASLGAPIAVARVKGVDTSPSPQEYVVHSDASKLRSAGAGRAGAGHEGDDGGVAELFRALAANRASRADREAWLARMTPEGRVAAMWRGDLSLRDFTYWHKIAAHEIPLIGGEYAWIAMRDPEWCE